MPSLRSAKAAAGEMPTRAIYRIIGIRRRERNGTSLECRFPSSKILIRNNNNNNRNRDEIGEKDEGACGGVLRP